MTKISAKVIADSKNEFGNRITTMIVTFPRFILAELNTHRMMSRNSASSRAIPFEKMIASVENDPFVPIAFQKDHKGMQGTEYLEGAQLELALQAYGRSVDSAIQKAKEFAATDATKQLVNRQLEPYMWHTVIVTATEWENFFALRCPRYVLYGKHEAATTYPFRSKKDALKALFGNGTYIGDLPTTDQTIEWLKLNKGQAEIHMMELAEQMWDAMNESVPKELKAGEWHIPFGDGIAFNDASLINTIPEMCTEGQLLIRLNEQRIKIATARCARVSYTVVGEEDKPVNYENDIKLHDRLAESGHWSPFEHCAQAMHQVDVGMNRMGEQSTSAWSGNFKGFIQYRKTFNNENITK